MATTCSKCKGTGEVEESEPRSFRRPRFHRFDTPDPPPCGIWRYQAVSAVKASGRSMTEGGTAAKPDPAPAPECAVDKIWPCSPECWRSCDRCHKLICEKHDHLVPVWPSGNGVCEPADMVCKECLAGLWSREDISQGRVQYIS